MTGVCLYKWDRCNAAFNFLQHVLTLQSFPVLLFMVSRLRKQILNASDSLQDYGMRNESRKLTTKIYFYNSYGSVYAI